jgi:hypothetical protein
MMEWLLDPRMWVAATPVCTFIGAAVGFYLATETGDDDPVPVVRRGDGEHEPWGRPYNTGARFRLPGDRVRRAPRVIEHDTSMLTTVGE